MAKKEKQKEVSINPDLLAQAENISKGIMERITKAHADSSKSKSARETLQKRKAENHLQREFDINVKDSFMLSLSNCLNAKGKIDPKKLAHLEAVMCAGPVKFDR